MTACFRFFAAALLCLAATAQAHVDVPGLDVNGQCVGDADSDGTVAIHEIVQAVNNALGTCPERPVEIHFAGVVGDADFACGQAYGDIGTGGGQLVPSDFRFYVSNVRLISLGGDEVPVSLEQDGMWQYENVALIDLEDGSGACAAFGNQPTNSTVRGSVPAGVYTGVVFELGVPFELNHGIASTAPAPLNLTAMFWSWQAGYKFIRVDTADDKFRVHVGSTGCQSDGPSRPPTSCNAPNRATVRLDGFNPEHSVIAADLKALLSQNDIDSNEPDTDPGCMASPLDDDCGPLFDSLGLTFPGGQPAHGQRFFRLRAERGGSDDHKEIHVAADAESGGTLLLHPEFDVAEAIPLFFAECFGGTGDDCAGGMRLFTAVNPGFSPLEESQPDESLYTVAAGAPITLEVTELAEGLTLRLGEVALDSPGDTALLGETPEFHADLEAQLLVPGGGAPSGTFAASFKVTTTAAGYEMSAPVTVLFTPSGEGGGEHH